MKKTFVLALTLCLSLSLAAPALAAGRGMENFQKTDTYTGQFADMGADHWATPWAALCYEYGLMKGASADAFNPEGTLTVAEAVVMASRVHEIYTTGQSTLTNGDPWYQPYADYAVENGLISPDGFADFTANATRAQMAQIFYSAVPEEEFPTVNVFDYIPDVDYDAPNARAIYVLYGAGVLTGSDIYGTFHPDNDVTRAEAAAILARVALPDQRREVVLMRDFALKNTVTGERIFKIIVPQTSEDLQDSYGVSYQEGEQYLDVFVFFTQSEEYAGKDIVEIYTTDEIAEAWGTAFGGCEYVTGVVQYGDTPAYLTTKLHPGEEDECFFDDLVGIDFAAGNLTVKVVINGAGCSGLFWQSVESVELLGSLLEGLEQNASS